MRAPSCIALQLAPHLSVRAGAHQMEPPSPIQALGVNPSRFINRVLFINLLGKGLTQEIKGSSI